MSYNVHGCVGLDGRMDEARIAQVIAHYEPDVVALQEVDVGRARSNGIDQGHSIAARLGMRAEFTSARACDGGHYGNAVLSAHPVARMREACLPHLHKHHEPRALQWVRIELPTLSLNVLNTHLGLSHRERLLQAATILGTDWVDAACATGPTVLCGDFNATPRSDVYRRLSASLRDAQRAEGVRSRCTFPSLFPMLRIDHMFLSPGLRVERCEVVANWFARLASDHLPLVVDVHT